MDCKFELQGEKIDTNGIRKNEYKCAHCGNTTLSRVGPAPNYDCKGDTMHKVPGGGNDNRYVKVLVPSGTPDKLMLMRKEFEDTKVGDVFITYEEDGTPVKGYDDSYVHVCVMAPKKNAEGKWGMASVTANQLAAFDPTISKKENVERQLALWGSEEKTHDQN